MRQTKTLLYLWCSVFAFAAAHVCVTTVKLFCLLPYAETPRSTPARFTLTAPLAALLLGVVQKQKNYHVINHHT